MHLVGEKDLHLLHEHINPDQILEDYGGTLKKPEKFWPPMDTFGNDPQPISSPEALEENYFHPNVHNLLEENFQEDPEQPEETDKLLPLEQSLSEIVPEDSMDEAINVKRKSTKYSSVIAYGSQPKETTIKADYEKVEKVEDIELTATTDQKEAKGALNGANETPKFTLSEADRARMMKSSEKKKCCCELI